MRVSNACRVRVLVCVHAHECATIILLPSVYECARIVYHQFGYYRRRRCYFEIHVVRLIGLLCFFFFFFICHYFFRIVLFRLPLHVPLVLLSVPTLDSLYHKFFASIIHRRSRRLALYQARRVPILRSRKTPPGVRSAIYNNKTSFTFVRCPKRRRFRSHVLTLNATVTSKTPWKRNGRPRKTGDDRRRALGDRHSKEETDGSIVSWRYCNYGGERTKVGPMCLYGDCHCVRCNTVPAAVAIVHVNGQRCG